MPALPLPRSRERISLPELVTLAAGAVICWWACAPQTTMPPPVSAGSASGFEVGGAVSLYDNGQTSTVRNPVLEVTPNAQLYGHFRLGESRAFLGGTVFGIGVAPYLRYAFVENERVFFGGQAQAGLTFVRAGIPLGVSPMDKLWLTTQPSVEAAPFLSNIDETPFFVMPVGASLELGPNSLLSLEGGFHLVSDVYSTDVAARPYVGLGFSVREANP